MVADSTEQDELPLFPDQLPEAPDDPELQRLISWLAEGSRRWASSAEIQSALGLSQRTTRRLAAASAGLILSGPGSPGYIFIGKASANDVREVCSKLASQADHMRNRARELRHQFHARA